MGCRSLWRFLSKKKHKPPLRYLRSQRDEGTSNQFRVDVQACLFSTIRYAYTASHSLEAAHSVVEKRIKKLVKNRTTAVLYFDGAPALEKQHTHRQRQELRTKALDNANKVVDNFVERVNNNQRIRKQHFITINKNLATAFRWDPVAKQSLIAYLRERGWDVVECPTEADTKIAEDCHPGDVVISSDSDSLVYRNISVVWRPISGGRFLVYNIDEVLSTLSLNRNQLTVLGIVSYNDYNKNIYGLGCATNYGIIKGFTEEGMEVPPMVEAYLTDSRVEFKNRDKLNFATSIQVFVGGRQTPVSFTTNNSSDDPGILTVEKVKARFAEASSMYKQRKSEEEMARQASKRSSSDTSTQRHKPSQRFNRYRTIDRPPPVEHKDITDTTKRKHSTAFVHRPRFSVKARTRKIKHEPPPAMKQYSWKSWKKKPESPAVDAIEAKPKPEEFAKSPSFKSPRPLGPMDKNQIVQELGREHPMAMLHVGTLAKNVKSALKDDVAIAKEAIGCLQEAVHEAYEVKRRAQRLVGMFVERMGAGDLLPTDREYLDLLCPRIVPEESNKNENVAHANPDDDDDIKNDRQQHFLLAFLRFLYSGNYPREQGVGRSVNGFIQRLKGLGLFDRLRQSPLRDRSVLRETTTFPPTELVRSVSSHLTVELKKMYNNGTREIQKQLEDQKVKDEDSLKGYDLEIHQEKTAVENFLEFNRMSGNTRRIAPISSSKDGFVSFSEREIIGLFWKRPMIKAKILELVTPVFPGCLALDDVTTIWLRDQEPGFVIKSLLCDVAPVGLTSRQRGKAGYRAAIKLMTIPEIKDHLSTIRQPDFDPGSYATKGYILRGSIRTNGFSIQLAAFKLKELQAVRYRRFPEDRLPSRLTTTVGGLDYYLMEIRNIARTKEDVMELWPNCAPDQIKILSVDLGQAYVVGAYASLPNSTCDTIKGTSQNASTAMDISTVSNLAPVTMLSSSPQPQVFYNLSVKQKAVSQPTFKFRRWTEDQKKLVPAGAAKSVQDIESDLPPLRGQDASVVDYVEEIQVVEDQLQEFYNGSNMRYQRHSFDASRAREEEFRTIADRLLSMIGGSVGAKRSEDDMVVIAIGLGQFASRSGLSSLHGTFFAFFVCLARSLGYIVVGVNEYYSSKKCPRCQAFVAQVTIRRLFCKACSMYLHRDEMAAHNMANAVRGHLLDQQRPDYLHPIDAQGRYPWKEDLSSSADGVGSSTSTSTRPDTDAKPKSTPTRQPRKRKATDNTQPQSSSARQPRKRKAIDTAQPLANPTRQSRKRKAVEEAD